MLEEKIILMIACGLSGLVMGFLVTFLLGLRRRKQLESTIAVQLDNLARIQSLLESTELSLEETKEAHQALKVVEKTQLEKLNHAQAEVYKSTQSIEQLESNVIQLNTELSKTKESLAATEAKREAEQQNVQQYAKALLGKENELKEQTEQVSRVTSHAASLDKKAKGFEVSEKEVREQLGEAKAQLHQAKIKNEALSEQNKSLDMERAELLKSIEEREASHLRELATFEKQKQSLSEQFKVLSTEILEAKTQSLTQNNKETLGAIIQPFQQTIDGFKKEVQEIHHRESMQQGELRKELENLKTLNQKITTEAHELSTALRGQKKLQGNWGELVLENVLDRSGLQLGQDYQREVSVTTEEGRLRPDAVVYLPQNKHLIIDAKVSLNAYTRFINSEDESLRAIAIKEHVEAMRARIKELSDKDYYKLPGFNSPEIVFMFVPIESAFVEALKADEGLFQSAISNNVLVATPTTLLTSLNIVRQLWRYEDQNKHTVALAQKAEGVFKKMNSFLGSFEEIKKSLEKATGAYTKAENQLVSGRGNLVKQVGEFKNLAPAIKSELPSYFAEKADLEVDYMLAHEEADNDMQTEVQVQESVKVCKSVDKST